MVTTMPKSMGLRLSYRQAETLWLALSDLSLNVSGRAYANEVPGLMLELERQLDGQAEDWRERFEQRLRDLLAVAAVQPHLHCEVCGGALNESYRIDQIVAGDDETQDVCRVCLEAGRA